MAEEGDPLRLDESEMFMSQVEAVVVEEGAVTDLAHAVALLRAVVPFLRHLVAHAAHPH